MTSKVLNICGLLICLLVIVQNVLAETEATSCGAIFWENVSKGESEKRTAFIKCLKDAEQGDPTAQHYVAESYKYGYGVPKNYNEAIRWSKESAIQGEEISFCQLANLYFDGDGISHDYANALIWYKKASDNGSVFATKTIGDMYFEGLGVIRSSFEAIRWYKIAADASDIVFSIQAQFALGKVYEINKDYKESIHWYVKAASNINNPSAEAQLKVGDMYNIGHGVPQSRAEAMKWYLTSYNNRGSAEASYKIGELWYEGNGVKKNYTNATNWFRNAALMDDVYSQVKLASCYLDGHGVKKDSIQAYVWFTLAAEKDKFYQKKCDQLEKIMKAPDYAKAKQLLVEVRGKIRQSNAPLISF